MPCRIRQAPVSCGMMDLEDAPSRRMVPTPGGVGGYEFQGRLGGAVATRRSDGDELWVVVRGRNLLIFGMCQDSLKSLIPSGKRLANNYGIIIMFTRQFNYR